MVARRGPSHRTSSLRGAGGRLRAGPGAELYIQLVPAADTAVERTTLQKMAGRGQRKGPRLPCAQAAHHPVWNWALATDNGVVPHLLSSMAT